MFNEEIIKKKAEVYDLIIKQQDLQNQLNALNQLINQKVAEIGKLENEKTT